MTWGLIPLTREQALYCLRVGLAVGLAYLLSHGSVPAGPLYAVLAAALVIGETTGEDIGISRNRLVGTVIGVLVAVSMTGLASSISIWTVTVTCVVAGLVALVVGEVGMARAAMTVSLVAVMLHPNDAVHFGLYRITNTAVGIAAALAVSYAFWPLAGRDALPHVLRNVLGHSAALLEGLASSHSPALRAHRQQVLFRTLSSLPKARKDAARDPLYRWRKPLAFEIVGIVVEVGISALMLSAEIGRLSAEQRSAAWWEEFAGVLNSVAGALRRASGHSPGRSPVTPLVPYTVPPQILTGEAAARGVIDNLMRHVQSMCERLEELRCQVETVRRLQPQPPVAPA